MLLTRLYDTRIASPFLRCPIQAIISASKVLDSHCDTFCAQHRDGNKHSFQSSRGFAGHNKWSKIKHKKGAKDVNRAKIFSKATRAIRAASKACNGDLSNLHLQSAIQSAKAIQVPKDRIEDAINRASKGSESDLATMRYDGHLNTPSGKVSLILTALTDNKNRTAANLRASMRKSHGELLNTGVHDWLFDHLGIVLVRKELDNSDDSEMFSDEYEETLLEHALEGGASDVDFGNTTDEHITIKCAPTDLHSVVIEMRDAGYDVSLFKSGYEPTSLIELNEESSDILTNFLEKMDDDEDINDVYFNASLFGEE